MTDCDSSMKLILAFIIFAVLSPNLSDEEKKGLYYCSETDVVLGIIDDNQYVTIIFARKAPVYFRKSELSKDLFQKISNISEGESYQVACIQAFWRDDWQKIYDKYKHVTDKLLEIEKTQP